MEDSKRTAEERNPDSIGSESQQELSFGKAIEPFTVGENP